MSQAASKESARWNMRRSSSLFTTSTTTIAALQIQLISLVQMQERTLVHVHLHAVVVYVRCCRSVTCDGADVCAGDCARPFCLQRRA